MCSVSAVMDYGQREFWPGVQIRPSIPAPLQPYVHPFVLPPVPQETPADKLREFLKLYEAAKDYDRKTAQPDCEDPIKLQVLERIMERLDDIERQLAAVRSGATITDADDATRSAPARSEGIDP